MAAEEVLAIVGGRVIDGLGGDPIEKSTILIERDRITAVGKDSAVPIPRGARVADAAGRTVLPGIIDCHVHSTYRARDIRKHLTSTPTYNVLRSTHILEETLACGVTTARDMGGADAGFREAIADGFVKGPRLLISIVMISQTGGHGDSWVPAGVRLQKRAWLPSGVCRWAGRDAQARTYASDGRRGFHQDLHHRRDHLADRQLGRAAIRRR